MAGRIRPAGHELATPALYNDLAENEYFMWKIFIIKKNCNFEFLIWEQLLKNNVFTPLGRA